MKKILAAAITLFIAAPAIANSTSINHCEAYTHNERYASAIKSISTELNLSTADLCSNKNLLSIYATPSRIVTPQGEVIPHTRVELVFAYTVCQYMVNGTNKEITSEKCYSAH